VAIAFLGIVMAIVQAFDGIIASNKATLREAA
jgi:hypothetical protein